MNETLHLVLDASTGAKYPDFAEHARFTLRADADRYAQMMNREGYRFLVIDRTVAR